MGFLANIPYTTEAGTIKPKTIKKLNKELGFDLVKRLMQVSMGFFFSHKSHNKILYLKRVGTNNINIFYRMNGHVIPRKREESYILGTVRD